MLHLLKIARKTCEIISNRFWHIFANHRKTESNPTQLSVGRRAKTDHWAPLLASTATLGPSIKKEELHDLYFRAKTTAQIEARTCAYWVQILLRG